MFVFFPWFFFFLFLFESWFLLVVYVSSVRLPWKKIGKIEDRSLTRRRPIKKSRVVYSLHVSGPDTVRKYEVIRTSASSMSSGDQWTSPVREFVPYLLGKSALRQFSRSRWLTTTTTNDDDIRAHRNKDVDILPSSYFQIISSQPVTMKVFGLLALVSAASAFTHSFTGRPLSTR